MFRLRCFFCFFIAMSLLAQARADCPEEAQKHVEKGEAALKKRDYDRAITEFTEAIKLDSQHTLAYFRRAETYLNKRQFDKAIADCDQVLQLDPNYVYGYLCRGSAYLLGKKQFDKALADLEQAIRLDPNNPYAYNWRGVYYQEKGEFDKAIRDCSHAIRLDPENALFYYERGNSYREKGDADKALADYSEAIKLDPEMASAYCNRCIIYHEKGDEDKALHDIDQANRLDPNSYLPYVNRALLLAASPLARIRNGERAVRDARKACELTEWKEPQCLDILAAAYAEAGDFKNAIKWEKKALQLYKDVPEVFLRDFRARLKLYEQGKPYREDLSARRNQAEKYRKVSARVEKGRTAHEKADYDRAIAEFTEALKLDPQELRAFLGRSAAYFYKGEYDKAISDGVQLLAFDPNCARGYEYRGASYLEKGNLKEALADFEQAIRLDPKNPAPYSWRGRYHQKKDEPEKAIRDFSQVLRLDPKDANVHFYRGDSYRELGDVDKALADYSEAIKLDPQMIAAYGNRGWLFATSPLDRIRNGERAVRDARKACELTDWKNPWYLEILAAAYAETGDFKSAIKWVKKALQLSSNAPEEILRETRARLKLYEQGKPYRENISASHKQPEKKGKKSDEKEERPRPKISKEYRSLCA